MIEPLLIRGEGGKGSEAVDTAVGCGYGRVVSVGVNRLPGEGRFRGALVRKDSVDSARGVVNNFAGEADLLVLDASASGLGSLAEEGGLDLVVGLAGREFVNPDVLRSLRRSGTGLLFDLSPVVSGKGRFGAMKRMVENAERCRYTGCPATVSTAPGDGLGVRAPREVEALAGLSGFTGEQFGSGQEFLEGVLDG